MEFKKIAEILGPLLPKGWEDVRLYAQLDKSSYEYFFYVKIDGEYIQNFELEKLYKISRKEMRSSFKNLYANMKDFQISDNWKVATFSMDSKGDFKITYDYDTPTELINIEYKNKWKTKYLK
ncbi:MAG: hypothetical protein B6229_05275 [Spirochaetaceae bacterium 4572_7]|nr:MAG: hypothetical protein B6229_05275 [Spirochaetaceae bacterium 4572_7]